ncbi:hypothetical protein P43SY_007307 [Pythium insidiosum]|uniref:Transmembrane protein n=1 Tax=Pythium insidiosum TaxID=114742 RepID=A0AAD5Q629_PYTIN|nr:hypothetical protein P43SY_007307 [Pythium insidiosum]
MPLAPSAVVAPLDTSSSPLARRLSRQRTRSLSHAKGPSLRHILPDDGPPDELTHRRWGVLHALSLAGRTINRLYQSLQIKLRGMYSIERLQAFEDYRRGVSSLHATGVALLTPIPALVVLLVLDSLPLSDPARGWRANGWLWLRNALAVFCMTLAIAQQFRTIIPYLPLRAVHVAGIALATALVQTLVMLFIAAAGAFPTPFAVHVGVPPWLLLFACMLWLVVRHELRIMPELRRLCWKYARVIRAQMLTLVLYSAWSIVFRQLQAQGRAQLVVVAVLPMLKLGMKNVIARDCAHLEDYVPQLTIFSVDVFNALFQCVSMQTATLTRSTVLVLVAVDMLQTAWAMIELRARTTIIQELRAKLSYAHQDLLDSVLEMCRDPQRHLHEDNLTQVRLSAAVRHRLSRRSTHILRRLQLHHRSLQRMSVARRLDRSMMRITRQQDLLDDAAESTTEVMGRGDIAALAIALAAAKGTADNATMPSRVAPTPSSSKSPALSRRSSSKRQLQRHSSRRNAALSMASMSRNSLERQSSVAEDPAPPSASPNATTTATTTGDEPVSRSRRQSLVLLTARQKTDLMVQTVRMLFQSECLVLTKYTECAMQILFMCYLPLRQHLAAARFYDAARASSLLTELSLLLLLASWRLGALLLLHWFLNRQFRVSATAQLAFVLEHQVGLVQGKLVMWVLLLFPMSLQHFGESGQRHACTDTDRG